MCERVAFASTYIDRLVPEILCEIFVFASPIPHPVHRRYRKSGLRFSWTISKVCRKWRTLAIDTALLWNYVRTEELLAFPHLLHRAKQASLTAFVSAEQSELEDLAPIVRTNESIFQCWDRILELQVEVSTVRTGRAQLKELWDTLCSKVSSPSPALERLRLRGYDSNSIPPQFVGVFPSLTCLHIDTINATWNSFKNVTTLKELNITQAGDDIAFPQYLSLLRSNPALETLEFYHQGWRDTTTIQPIPLSSPVHLPCLGWIYLIGTDVFINTHISHVNASSRTNWILKLTDYEWDFPIVILPPSRPEVKPTYALISLDNYGPPAFAALTCQWDDIAGSGDINWRFEFVENEMYSLPSESLRLFALYLRKAPLSQLTNLFIYLPSPVCHWHLDHLDLRSILLATPLLENLALHDGLRLVMALDPIEMHVQDLQAGTADPGPPTSHVCPYLKSLLLVDMNVGPAAEDSYRQMYFEGVLPLILLKRRERGFPLKTLRLSGPFYDNVEIQILEDCVGEATLHPEQNLYVYH